MERPLTRREVDEIDGRAAAATPGPWRAYVEGRDHLAGDTFIQTSSADDRYTDLYVDFSSAKGRSSAPDHDIDFIATARADVPALVATVRLLRDTPARDTPQVTDIGAPVSISLTRDEALVLFDWLQTHEEGETTHGDSAEQAALRSLSALLERELDAPFRHDYNQLLQAAKDSLTSDGS